MNLTTCVLNLNERLGKRIETVQKMESDKGIGHQIQEISDLKRDMNEDKEKLVQLLDLILSMSTSESVKDIKREIEVLKENETSYIKRIAELEKEIFKQDDKIKDLKEDMKNLRFSSQASQAATDFENDLAKYIYPRGKVYGSRKIFTKLKEWLERERDTPQGREANRKWNDLKNEFSWSDDHEKVLLKIVKGRTEFQPTNPETIKTQATETFTDEEKQCIQTIINITTNVNEMF